MSEFVTRVSAGIATLLSLGWFLWPTNNWKFEPEPFVASITTFIFWIGLELKENFISHKVKAHPHDIKLLSKFRNQISHGTRLFLSEHDFRNPINIDELSSLITIHESWRGADFEFEDVKINSVFKSFLKFNSEFCNLSSSYLYTKYTNTKIFSVKTDLDIMNNLSQDTVNNINELNKAALKLYEAINDVERIARKQLNH